jgi:hypothetical protein
MPNVRLLPGVLGNETDAAYLVLYDINSVWIPKSQVIYYELDDAAPGIAWITLVLPQWLVVDKELEDFIDEEVF